MAKAEDKGGRVSSQAPANKPEKGRSNTPGPAEKERRGPEDGSSESGRRPSGSSARAQPGGGDGNRRRRGSRGGRSRQGPPGSVPRADDAGQNDDSGGSAGQDAGRRGPGTPATEAGKDRNPELPERSIEGRPKSREAAEAALVRRKPKIGDTMPAPSSPQPPVKRRRRRKGAGGGGEARPVEAVLADEEPLELDEKTLRRRRGRQRKGKAVGRYLMCVHVRPEATQIAVLEGRALVEHYVSRPADDISQIYGNIYLGRVQNVLPGMEAAFVDIATPKNAVLYQGDVQYDREDIDEGSEPRIEEVLKPRQMIMCQVTKNPIAHKGARLTQEVSLPGRFVVLVPHSRTYGISKRLPDEERRRLRSVLDKCKPAEHGIIVRTAAENVTEEEITRDVVRLLKQWEQIEALAGSQRRPGLLYREPDMAVRVIREEFNKDYRGVIIDETGLYDDVRDYVAGISPALADRIQFYDREKEELPLFERYHVHQQLQKALDRKVWLPSGGSLVVEHTEALTVIDVNTGKNVGSSSLEETVFRNNLEAAVEIARQLRLRDIGGIIVIDFVDMEIKENRDEVIRVFRDALGRDKTRAQVFNISELGLVEMTRKRIGEGLLESLSEPCEACDGRGVTIHEELLG
ncbi:MAG: Ribonuclease E [Acidimicrobiales bacterium]|nr:MAG: Rne/Rng family ribonuclease [Actinomycetota bacterium]MBV6507615.1 Ribonuclease E [Acidimicrobiales bacterium]RIK07549.1 MAG: ribonuclease E/G [Acidobacteriota bacterium]